MNALDKGATMPRGDDCPKRACGVTQRVWVFQSKRVWIKGCEGVMGYDYNLPANQLGGQIFLWDVIEYGSPGIWDRRESTVLPWDPSNSYVQIARIPRWGPLQTSLKFSLHSNFDFFSFSHCYCTVPSLKKNDFID